MKKIMTLLISGLLSSLFAQTDTLSLPQTHFQLKRPLSYPQMQRFFSRLKKNTTITVTEEGKTAEGRSLYLVHMLRGENPRWRLFFYAQQHGDEPSGKDALLYMIKYFNEKPEFLPEDVDVWLMPMVNPDGAVRNQRRNAGGFDLNRDHILLSQPEIQTLYRVVRRINPHIAVDCHEYGRDAEEFAAKGWHKWPIIMMDCANNPLFGNALYEAGVNWCERVKKMMTRRNHSYTRYYVGGAPPDDEIRHSTLDLDDGRNGIGAYGGLSFIIEAGARHKAPNPYEDLYKRVDAYLDLLMQFVLNAESRKSDLSVIDKTSREALPEFIPVNYFWANKDNISSKIKVVDTKSGHTLEIATPNFMSDRVIKKSVRTPSGYIIPVDKAQVFKELLDRHALQYDILSQAQEFIVEPYRLIAVEDSDDVMYQRYGGRQIVEIDSARSVCFQPGSILAKLSPEQGKRAILLLEPARLYGLFQYTQFRNLVGDDRVIPVYRFPQK